MIYKISKQSKCIVPQLRDRSIKVFDCNNDFNCDIVRVGLLTFFQNAEFADSTNSAF